MNSLSEPLKQCPLCQEKWCIKNKNYAGSSWTEYYCPDDLAISYWESNIDNRLAFSKKLTDKISVSWYSYFPCSVNRGDVNEGNILLTYVLPFDITVEKLHTYLVFS